MERSSFSRRSFLKTGSAAAAGIAATAFGATGCTANTKGAAGSALDKAAIKKAALAGTIRHSACRWCYHSIPLDLLCEQAKEIGVESIDLLSAGKELETVTKHGLTCAMVRGHSLTKGMNNKKYHAKCIEDLRTGIDGAAEYDMPNVVTFSGNSEGIDDETGIKNAVEGYKQIIGYAEKKNVTLCIEYLNSKVDHKGYMFDNMAWGVEVCKRVGSENLKILYDIYHAQIMEGDVIRTIRDNTDYIGHYHTGGVPGRNEIDNTQELYYPAIMRAIVETGYKGFVGQEFVPTKDPITSLAEAVQICTV